MTAPEQHDDRCRCEECNPKPCDEKHPTRSYWCDLDIGHDGPHNDYEDMFEWSARPPAPPLSFEEQQIVRRFEEAPDPWCPLCDGVGEVQARLPHVLTWDRIPCPECMPAVER